MPFWPDLQDWIEQIQTTPLVYSEMVKCSGGCQVKHQLWLLAPLDALRYAMPLSYCTSFQSEPGHSSCL